MINYKGIFKTFINGELVDEGPNQLTNLGRKYVLDIWKGTTNVVPWMNNGSAYLAVGEGSGGTTLGMGSLINELGATSGNRAEFINVTRVNDAGSVITGSVSFGGSGGRGNLWEVGVFVTGYDGATLKPTSTARESGILFARRALDNQQLVNSGGVLELQYQYTLWDS